MVLDRLAEIEEPRNEKGRRHPLHSILGLVIIGFMSGRRGHWSIENKSHWMQDTVFGEDASPVRCGAIPQVMATLRNAALAVLRFAGVTCIADKIKYYASKPLLAVNLITECF
ncbi:hypothetical protein C6501_01000 [Candidatus Poribacteria bacterium]|nr:MAG: hypothetical protein C6501_01000 [Candidatus Poribacteria bacterium]